MTKSETCLTDAKCASLLSQKNKQLTLCSCEKTLVSSTAHRWEAQRQEPYCIDFSLSEQREALQTGIQPSLEDPFITQGVLGPYLLT